MKTTLYSSMEALNCLTRFAEQELPGLLALKIFDNSDVLLKKSQFLDQETRKIIEQYQAVPEKENDPSCRLVVLGDDGVVDEDKTQLFSNKIFELRNMEIDVNVEPFTEDDIARMKMKPIDAGKIRFMIDKDSPTKN